MVRPNFTISDLRQIGGLDNSTRNNDFGTENNDFYEVVTRICNHFNVGVDVYLAKRSGVNFNPNGFNQDTGLGIPINPDNPKRISIVHLGRHFQLIVKYDQANIDLTTIDDFSTKVSSLETYQENFEPIANYSRLNSISSLFDSSLKTNIVDNLLLKETDINNDIQSLLDQNEIVQIKLKQLNPQSYDYAIHASILTENERIIKLKFEELTNTIKTEIPKIGIKNKIKITEFQKENEKIINQSHKENPIHKEIKRLESLINQKLEENQKIQLNRTINNQSKLIANERIIDQTLKEIEELKEIKELKKIEKLKEIEELKKIEELKEIEELKKIEELKEIEELIKQTGELRKQPVSREQYKNLGKQPENLRKQPINLEEQLNNLDNQLNELKFQYDQDIYNINTQLDKNHHNRHNAEKMYKLYKQIQSLSTDSEKRQKLLNMLEILEKDNMFTDENQFLIVSSLVDTKDRIISEYNINKNKIEQKISTIISSF